MEYGVKNTKEIGERIRKMREEAGLSQLALAKKMGCKSGNAVSLMESGERMVKSKDLTLLSVLLHCHPLYLLGEQEEARDVREAVRADDELSSEDKETLLHMIDVMKGRRRGAR